MASWTPYAAPKGFIRKWERVPTAGYELAERILVGDWSDDERRFWIHVLVSSRSWNHNDGWVPISRRLMDLQLRSGGEVPRWREMVGAGLLEFTPHSIARGRSREFRIPRRLVNMYNGAVWDALTETEAPTPTWVNLFTGTGTKRVHKTPKRDTDGRPVPTLSRLGVLAIERGVFNRGAVSGHLKQLRKDLEDVELDLSHAERRGLESAPQLARMAHRAFARFTNDLRCFEWVMGQRAAPLPDDAPAWTYVPAYAFQSTGRVHPNGSGGLQSCSRDMKAAAYHRVSDVHNFDLKASQPSLLLDEFERAGIDCEWLGRYLRDYAQGRRGEYADRCGLSEGAWKECFTSIIFGARVPESVRTRQVEYHTKGGSVKRDRPVHAVTERILADVGEDKLVYALGRFSAEVEPLLRASAQWRAYLGGEWISEGCPSPGCTRTHGSKGTVVRNAVGARFNVNERRYGMPKGRRRERQDWRRKLAAFVLQGREAALISELAQLGDRYGFEPVANEHDGLVSIGTIPDAAVEEARERVGAASARLVTKPIADRTYLETQIQATQPYYR